MWVCEYWLCELPDFHTDLQEVALGHMSSVLKVILTLSQRERETACQVQ